MVFFGFLWFSIRPVIDDPARISAATDIANLPLAGGLALLDLLLLAVVVFAFRHFDGTGFFFLDLLETDPLGTGILLFVLFNFLADTG